MGILGPLSLSPPLHVRITLDMAERKMNCPDPRIGAYCLNNGREKCITDCALRGTFHLLEPVTLDSWELPPELPPYRELFRLDHHAVRGVFYLAIHYQQEEGRRNA